MLHGKELLYQSPPGSGGNDGVLPTVWDPLWANYDNLTLQQITAFQNMPPALLRYLAQMRWQAEISGVTLNAIPLTTQDRDQQKIAGLKQAFDNGAITGTVAFSDAAGNTQIVDATATTAIYRGVVTFVQQTYATAASLKAAINATPPTVTTRVQIDQAFAAIAPNSPSVQMLK